MLTKEENQILINEFVEKNVDAITNLGEDKQKAVLDAILLIQNKFGNITQSLLKDNLIKPIQNEPLPFKVGDKFNIKIRGTGNIYVIDSIESNRVVVKIKLNDGQIHDYDYSIEEVKKAFEDGTWVKIEDESIPFEVGDKIYNKNTPNNIDTIIKIDKETDFFQIETTDGRKLQGSLKDTIEDVKSGDLIVVKNEPLPFKVGDNFYVFDDPKSIRTIIEIDESKNYFEFYNDGTGKTIRGFKLNEAKQNFKDGEWVLIKDIQLPFKEGDKFVFDAYDTINTIIKIDPNKNYFEFQEDKDGTKLNGWTLQEAKELFKDGRWKLVKDEPLPFKVGDKFMFVSADSINTILKIDPSTNYFEFELDGISANAWSLDEAKEAFKDGRWILVKDDDILVDMVVINNRTNDEYKVLNVDAKANNVSMVSKTKGKSFISLSALIINLKNGKWSVKVSKPSKFKFEIGDMFEEISDGTQYVLIDIINDFDQYVLQKVGSSYAPIQINYKAFESDIQNGLFKQIFVNQSLTTSTTTTTTSKALPKKSKKTYPTTSPIPSPIQNKDEEIEALEEAIETQKLLLSFADTKDEKEEIKNLLKDLRSQLKNLKK